LSEYFIWRCTNCGASILCNTNFREDASGCCTNSNFEMANVEVEKGHNIITLPDNEEIPEPEIPRRSRIELALEDAFRG